MNESTRANRAKQYLQRFCRRWAPVVAMTCAVIRLSVYILWPLAHGVIHKG